MCPLQLIAPEEAPIQKIFINHMLKTHLYPVKFQTLHLSGAAASHADTAAGTKSSKNLQTINGGGRIQGANVGNAAANSCHDTSNCLDRGTD